MRAITDTQGLFQTALCPAAATLLFLLTAIGAHARGAVVADSVTRQPLPNAAVFDRHGRMVGSCGQDGSLPHVYASEYPVTVRHMGFREKSVRWSGSDTVFLQELHRELPEVVIESRRHKMLHLLGYVREYSTLSTYSDTIFLFREKMVDYMIPTEEKTRFKGWSSPRVLSSRSYYRFTDAQGLDSVSDRCNQHFSWADWVGVTPSARIPGKLAEAEAGTDTVRGKYSPAEIWSKNGSRVTLDINIMADTTSRKWVPNLSAFFRGNVDFERFHLRFDFDNVAGFSIDPADLAGYSFNIESNGRGRGMFMFNRRDEPFFVSTYAEVYIIDKEYITVKEARKWEKKHPDTENMAIYEPPEAPPPQPAIRQLVARVDAVDHSHVRLALVPDKLLVGKEVVKMNVGQQALQRIKGLLGIDNIIARRKWKHGWNDFQRDRMERNNARE